jgi:hypothetical protein
MGRVWFAYLLSAVALFILGYRTMPFSRGHLDTQQIYYQHRFQAPPIRYPAGVIESADEICPVWEYASHRKASSEMRSIARQLMRRQQDVVLVRNGTAYDVFGDSNLADPRGECRVK